MFYIHRQTMLGGETKWIADLHLLRETGQLSPA